MPGQIIKYKNNSIKKSFYTNSKLNNNIHKSFKSPTEQLDKLLNQSVKDRLIADVPVGVFLSGGIDSSLIAYMQKKIIIILKVILLRWIQIHMTNLPMLN